MLVGVPPLWTVSGRAMGTVVLEMNVPVFLETALLQKESHDLKIVECFLFLQAANIHAHHSDTRIESRSSGM